MNPAKRIDTNRVTLVLAERDVEDGSLAHALGEATNHAISIVQDDDESPTHWTRRIRSHVDEINRSGQKVTKAFLLGGAQWQQERLSARVTAARVATQSMMPTGGGKLILDAKKASQQSKRAMRAVANTMEAHLSGSSVAVTKRVDEKEIG